MMTRMANKNIKIDIRLIPCMYFNQESGAGDLGSLFLI